MPRSARDTRLETRTARARLAVSTHPYQRLLERGLYLLYYRGRRRGSWSARAFVRGRYVERRLALADDHVDANGESVLDFAQAQMRAWAKREELLSDPDATERRVRTRAGREEEELADVATYTVREAIEEYLAWYASHRKALANTRRAADAHILPTLGDELVADLTPRRIRQWHERLATAPARLRSKKGADQRTKASTDPRARRASANRILTVFKAALNHAYHEGRVPSDEAWRRVRPFRRVDSPKVRYLTEDECRRLVNACAPDFRRLVQGALYTGCRYGELAALRCEDVNPDAGTVTVRDSKSGRPRHVPLTTEGARFFERETAGRRARETLFLRSDGSRWGPAYQKRPIRAASEAAMIDPPVSFHVLRHTYASWLAMRRVPLQVIATALGHADTRMAERHYAHLAPSYVADTIRACLPDLAAETGKIPRNDPVGANGSSRT